MQDKNFLNEVIDDKFIEFGKSGYFFSKFYTIKSLQECIEDRKIKIYNYECEQIDTNTYLIHYITKSYDKFIYRTSIWIMKDNLKLLFHQASMLNEELELKEY